MGIIKSLATLKNEIPDHVQLVAVSKTKPVDDILIAYESGHRIFGENKVQEITHKHPLLPSDIEWHFIGHLQSNKVKYIAPFIHLIHAVDSLKLLKEINKQALKNNRLISCLLQFHIASESSKYGLHYDEAKEILISESFAEMHNICIAGVMGMATFTTDENIIRGEFKQLKEFFTNLKKEFFQENNNFKEISMGMSDDFGIAIEEGSSIVRIGSSIFGSRNL